MYVGRDFDVADSGESEVYTLDFVNDLAASDSLATVTWSLSVNQGTDPSPNSHLSGSAVIAGTQTLQRISGLLPGVNYKVEAVVTTTLGNTVSLWSHVRCQTPF